MATGFRAIACGFLIGVLLGGSSARAETKLYLKDGSYQLVKTYQIQGDRVRYYSVERSEWEQVPKALVDFAATERAAKQETAEHQQAVQKAHQIETERFDTLPQTGFEIQPGIRLPSDEGVYVFDGTMLRRLAQSSAEIVRDKKRMLLMMAMPAPVLKGRSLVVLEGARAAVRLTATRPVFYVEAADGWGARAQLIPLEVRKDRRLLEKVQSGVGVGKSGEEREMIPIERTQVAPGIFKLHPTGPLKPGEYAVGELLHSQKLNIDVWDFGIDGPPRSESAKK